MLSSLNSACVQSQANVAHLCAAQAKLEYLLDLKHEAAVSAQKALQGLRISHPNSIAVCEMECYIWDAEQEGASKGRGKATDPIKAAYAERRHRLERKLRALQLD